MYIDPVMHSDVIQPEMKMHSQMWHPFKVNIFTWNFMVPNKNLFIIQSINFSVTSGNIAYKQSIFWFDLGNEKKNLLWNVRMMQRMQPYSTVKLEYSMLIGWRVSGRMAEVVVHLAPPHHRPFWRFSFFFVKLKF